MKKKSPRANLRSFYTLFVQIGLIFSLLFIIAITKVDIQDPKTDEIFEPIKFEPDSLIDIPQTTPPKKPAPHKPAVINEVPDNEIIEDEPIGFMEFDTGEQIELPPAPVNSKDEDIFDSFGLEFAPKMNGGVQALYSKIKYPELAKKLGIEGRVTVKFVINKKGEVENPEIVRRIGGGCDEEVLRVIKLMKFTPGIQNGNIVKVRMYQSVQFRLEN